MLIRFTDNASAPALMVEFTARAESIWSSPEVNSKQVSEVQDEGARLSL